MAKTRLHLQAALLDTNRILPLAVLGVPAWRHLAIQKLPVETKVSSQAFEAISTFPSDMV